MVFSWVEISGEVFSGVVFSWVEMGLGWRLVGWRLGWVFYCLMVAGVVIVLFSA